MTQTVAMNELARRIFAVLERHAVFPAPILTAQCKYLKKTPETIERGDLPRLAENIGRAVALFSNPAKGRAVSEAILALAGPEPVAGGPGGPGAAPPAAT